MMGNSALSTQRVLKRSTTISTFNASTCMHKNTFWMLQPRTSLVSEPMTGLLGNYLIQ
jgi:hypothetical protein